MKIVSKYIEKDSSGRVRLVGEDDEDMWHIYNIIAPNDILSASTVRKIQSTSSTGSVDNQKIRLTLQIRVVSVDFDSQVAAVRVNGRVAVENQHVKLGAHHTIDLELNQSFEITKTEWDKIHLDIISQACDMGKKAEIAAIVLEEGLANICLLTDSMTIVKQRIEVSVPRKRKGSSSSYDKGLNKFFEQIKDGLDRFVDLNIVKCLIIASPGFLKDQVFRYIFAEANKTGNKEILKNKSKIILIHSSSGHKHALQEVLQDPSVQIRLADTRYAQEVKVLDNFFQMLNNDPDRAFYGFNHVQKAVEIGAVDTLLLSDDLFRSADIVTRKKYIHLVETVPKSGGKVYIFSSLHVTGEQLSQLTGVAAILRFSAPEIEENE